ncbi:MAG TPA: nucleotide exchange factor GrpE [Candidatus Omnitrophica bacterium]|nr:nucleotide exchange factor GrpE [Candidatus Omnitrophota bacterium]
MTKNNTTKKEKTNAASCTSPVIKDAVTIARSEYDSLKQDRDKASQHWNRLVNAQAEFENVTKRMEREKQDFVKFANESLIFDLLTILDDLERSLELTQQKEEKTPGFLKGIELILGHLYEMLKKRGLSPIEAEGKSFDPEYHEALLHIDTNDLPEHTIVEELQRGYLLNGKVLRTAKVKISKKKSQNSEE